MQKKLLIRQGETVLKGANRRIFENRLMSNIRYRLKKTQIDIISLDKKGSIIELYINESNVENCIKKLKEIPGISSVSKVMTLKKDYDILKRNIVDYVNEVLTNEIKTFKVICKRVDKSFIHDSLYMNKDIGGYILSNFNDRLSVDVIKPDMTIYITINKDIDIFIDRIKCIGGLPVGTGGKSLLQLSGGIDSPVAGYLLYKRGMKLDYVHFHTYPFTSKDAFDKVFNLAKIISKFSNTDSKFYSINILNVNTEIKKIGYDSFITVLNRRFMVRACNEIARMNNYSSIITGESLGQVASQTIENINISNTVSDIPILRPLIGYDKTEIINIARNIDTYKTSILPFEDCCTVFSPNNPVTKAKLSKVVDIEKELDVEQIVENMMQTLEIIEVK